MNEAVEDCLVEGYDHLIPAVTLPDEDDRHVVAAAHHGRADVIVTTNLKDLPAAELARFNLEAQHPDVFIRRVFDLDGEALVAVAMVRRRLRNPPGAWRSTSRPWPRWACPRRSPSCAGGQT